MSARLVAVRAALFGLAAASVSTLGHAWAGGSPPGPGGFVALVLLAAVPALPLLGRERTLLPILALLSLAQVGLHLALSAGPAHHAEATAPSTSMLAVHLLLVLVSAWWLRRGEVWLWRRVRRSVHALTLLLRQSRADVRRRSASGGMREVPRSRVTSVPRPLVDRLSRRGPPGQSPTLNRPTTGVRTCIVG